MPKLRILDFSSFSEEVFHEMMDSYIDPSRYEVVRIGKNSSEDRVHEMVKDAEIILTDPLHFNPVTRRIIEAGDKLRLIQCYTIGFDDVDVKAARERGIPVANNVGVTARSMAEYTIMASIYLLKNIGLAHTEFMKGNWVQQMLLTPAYNPHELGSVTLGILGCGNIGQEVAKLARVFGSRILYHKRNRLPEDVEQSLGLEYTSFEDLLRRSDVLSINLPLTSETQGIMGAAELYNMKQGAVLVNTSRGGIVDEKALADALASGHLRGAAVDVFENEPNISSCPLLGLKNVLLTPHSSAISSGTMKRSPVMVVENLNRIYEGKPPLRIVN
jgi:phosphoglycerate dehydrogenase-like enzyme